MSKTGYVICAINLVASAFALFWIFQSSGKARMAAVPAPSEIIQPVTAKKAVSIEEAWQRLQTARTYAEAGSALADLPSDQTTLGQLHAFIIQADPTDTGESWNFSQVGRKAACIQALAPRVEWESDHRRFLQALARDDKAGVLLRDVALRGVVDIALRRRQTAKGETASAWREELRAFLAEGDFGMETSIEGLALQAMVFLKQQEVIDVGAARLGERVGRILEASSSAQESTLIAALEIGASLLPNDGFANAVRRIASAPKSEAVFQAAAICLGRLLGPAELEKMGAAAPRSTATYHALETAWARLGEHAP